MAGQARVVGRIQGCQGWVGRAGGQSGAGRARRLGGPAGRDVWAAPEGQGA